MTDTKSDRKNRKGRKKAEGRGSKITAVAIPLGLCALIGVGIWSLFSSDGPAPTAPSLPAATGPWTQLESQPYGFRISVPAEARRVQGGGEDSPVAMWLSTFSTGVVQVTVSKCPERVCEEVPDSVLKGMAEGTISQLGGAVRTNKVIELPCPKGKCPGRELDADGPAGMRVLSRSFVAAGRIYQLSVTDRADAESTFKKVVDSFTFLAPESGQAVDKTPAVQPSPK